jgi:MFS family permease
MLAAGVYAFDATRSPFLVALLVILRMLPFAVFGSVIGTFADRTSPSFLLCGILSAAACGSATVFLFFSFGQARYWVLALASLVSGIVWASDMPLRRRMLGDIAGIDRIVPAMGLDSATSSGTRVLGPLLGGLLYQTVGIGGAFALSASFYIVSAIMILRIPPRISWRINRERATGIMHDFQEVFAFVARDRDVLAILSLTVVYNVWGFPFISMIPVVGRHELGLSAGWIGCVAALEGAGALLGALVIAVRLRTRHLRRLYYFSILAYLVFAFTAGWAAHALPMAALVFCVGLAAAGFSTMQNTLIYSVAPPHMRSRLFGLVVFCIGTGLIGIANIGLMGEWFGGPMAIQIVAAEGLVPLTLIGLSWRQLGYQTPRVGV